MDLTDRDTKHIKDRSTDPEGHLEYTKENEKGRLTNLMWETRKTNTMITIPGREYNIKSRDKSQYSMGPKQKQANGAQVMEITVHQGRVKTTRTKLDDQYKVY